MKRIGLVVHPRREIDDGARRAARAGATQHGVELVQVPARPGAPRGAGGRRGGVRPRSSRSAATARRSPRSAPPRAAGRPVLGIACGSLGALTRDERGRPRATRSTASRRATGPRGGCPRSMVESPGERARSRASTTSSWCATAPGRSRRTCTVDGELFIRFAGDGLVVATALGSSAYTLAAGGPVLAPGAAGMVFTPLAPHGGCCPPLRPRAARAGCRSTFEPGLRRRADRARRADPGPARAARHRASSTITRLRRTTRRSSRWTARRRCWRASGAAAC